jgi:hypothetical protein
MEQPSPLTADHRAAAPQAAASLRVLLAGLGTLIARGLLRHPTYAIVILPLWNYLNRIARRFDRLMARIAAGTSRPRPRAASARAPEPSGRLTPRLRLPPQKAWLLAALKHEAAFYTGRIETLLSEPGTAELLAATPQAVRLLRPLCRMLGVQHPAIPPLPRRRRQLPELPPTQHVSPARPRGRGPGGGGCDTTSLAAVSNQDDHFRPSLLLPCPRLAKRWPWNQHPAFRTA